MCIMVNCILLWLCLNGWFLGAADIIILQLHYVTQFAHEVIFVGAENENWANTLTKKPQWAKHMHLVIQ